MLTTHTLVEVPISITRSQSVGSGANSQATKHEHANQLRLPLLRYLQSPQNRHRNAQRHNVSEGIERANNDICRVYADTSRIWHGGIPSSSNRSTLDQQHEELGCAVADYEGANCLEDNE